MANLGKHDIPLAAVADLSWEAALVWLDYWTDCGEVRLGALAQIGDILFFEDFVESE